MLVTADTNIEARLKIYSPISTADAAEAKDYVDLYIADVSELNAELTLIWPVRLKVMSKQWKIKR